MVPCSSRGPVLHGFALALTIGILFGIYSSIFVMAPITLWLGIKREDLIKPVKSKVPGLWRFGLGWHLVLEPISN